MTIRFIPISEIKEPLNLSIGLSGGSGSGKTYSALKLARGIAHGVTGKKGAPIGYVDTENRRALHYKNEFPELMHFDMQAVDDDGEIIGFPPERWIEVIDHAESLNLPVLVVDSFSHAWEGVNGVLDLQAKKLNEITNGNESRQDMMSQLAWANIKPRYRRLVDRIVRAKTNIILCTRAKPVLQDVKTQKNLRKTKIRRFDIPWDIAADGDLIFEMTAQIMLTPERAGCPTHHVKVADQFKSLFVQNKPMDEIIGYKMALWAKGNSDEAANKAIIDNARSAARNGRDAFLSYWNGDEGKSNRQTLASIIDELRQLVDEAEAAYGDQSPFNDEQEQQSEVA